MAIRGQITLNQTGIAGVLKQYRLAVQPNQREYSWTEKEVTTLFQDFARAVSEEEGEYFLGTIVTIPQSPEVLEVVDGQQRLATVAMLLCEIRNYLLDREPMIAESIDNGFLTDIVRRTREKVTKLQLNVDDNEFFRGMMTAKKAGELPEATKPSHRLIRDAFQNAHAQVKRVVSGLDSKDHGDLLDKWITFMEHGAQVILLKVPAGANAYKMFETLNDRGLKTSQADLVKNYLFGQAGSRLKEVQQKWALMRGVLQSINDEEDLTVVFLRHALIVIRGFLREGDVFEVVQASAKGPQTSAQLVTTLENLANTYGAIFNPEHEKWNAYPDLIRRAIRTLNLLNIRSFHPLLLAVASKFSPNEANEAFRMAISWGVRLLIVSGVRSGSVEETLAGAANKVFEGKITQAAAFRKELNGIVPVDGSFRQAFEVATVSKASLARYYLRSLERAAKQEANPWYEPTDDKETINLEHILPERPEGKWKKQFDDETARLNVKKLGNLALMLARSNSDLRNAEFNTKKAVYKASPYELTRQISKAADWTPTQIARRQKGLAELALKTWPI